MCRKRSRRNGAPCGDSRSGRHLPAQLRAAGLELLAAGGSDWVVLAGPEGTGPEGYPGDEAFFLRYLVDTIDGALADAPDVAAPELAAWTAARHGQIDRGELVWISHNLDALARAPAE